MTFDAWMRHAKLDWVDYVKVDVEGFDPDVVRGALPVLRERKIGMISFEIGSNAKGRPWATTTIKQMVDELEQVGYYTYFIGDYRLYKMSHGCWDGVYDEPMMFRWANAVAIMRTHPLHDEVLKAFRSHGCKRSTNQQTTNKNTIYRCSRFSK